MNQNMLGLLGPSTVQLNCSYDIDTDDVLFLINFKAFIRGTFRNIVSFSPPNIGGAALILTDGFYLIGRVTLTNPTFASTTAIMTFNEVDCEDENDYQCEINYQDGTTGESPSPLPLASTNLTVRAAAEKPAEAPLITGVNGSIIEGQNVTFTCSGNVGNPPGTFIWEKFRMIGFFPTTYPDEPTIITPGLVNCTNNGTSSVTIAMESEDDRSLVRCVIKQEFGDVFQQTPIISVLYSVRETVVTPNPDQPSYIEGSDPITLTCWGAGNPIPTYTWYKEANDTILSNTSAYVINDVTVENSGNYICVIENMVDGIMYNDSSDFNIIIGPNVTSSSSAPSSSPTGQPSSTVVVGGQDSVQDNLPAIIGGSVAAIVAVTITIFICKYTLKKNGKYDGQSQGQINHYETNFSSGNTPPASTHHIDLYSSLQMKQSSKL
ncbi:cell adhesion molecule 2-like [Mytilus californianus]|uniref:cell adhesion molecule 2-like n=1 Tax=Mytilus californianus TaxID=6549 RepID=UPI0022464F54|nr:cell adhesion molecule 2-like [Mytilus californianus]